MQEIILNQTNHRPTSFIGEEILFASTKDRDRHRSEFYNIRLCRHEDGFYRIGIGLITYREKKRDKYWIIDAKTPTEVMEAIEQYVVHDNCNCSEELQIKVATELKETMKVNEDIQNTSRRGGASTR